MAKSLWALGVNGTVLGANATRYLPYGCAWLDMSYSTLSGSAVEAEAEIKLQNAGTVSKASIYLSANGVSATSTLKSRKNAADGNISVSITASTTGRFEDTSNSDSYSAGDTGCFKLTTGGTGASLTPRTISSQFEATTDTVQVWNLVSISTSGIATASTTHYHVPAGRWQGSNATANNAKIEPGCGGTWEKMRVYAQANARTSSSTLRNRINASNGAMSVTIGSGATGEFQDTSNSDSISAGDDLDLSWTSGTGTGSCPISTWKTEVRTTDGKFSCVAGNASSGMGVSGNTTRYISVGGSAVDATEANSQNKFPFSIIASYLTAYVSANTNAATATVTIRDDGANTGVTFTIGSTASGQFKDTSNTASIASNSLVNVAIVNGNGGGTTTFRNFSSTYAEANHTASIPLSTLTLTAQTPSASAQDNIYCSVPKASLTLTTQTPGATSTESSSDSCSLPAASLTLTAQTPSATLAPLTCELPTSNLSLIANTPGATKTENFSSQLPTASLTLTANNPSATTTEHISSAIPSASLTLTPNAPQNTVPNNQYAAIPVANLTLTPQAPAFSLPDSSSSIPLATLTLTANAPGATVTEHMSSGLPSAELTLTPQTPQVTLEPLTCSLPSLSLTLSPQTPQATTAGTDAVSLPSASLALTPNVPGATKTEHMRCSMSAASLTLTAQTPLITTTTIDVVDCEIPRAEFAFAAHAPHITVTQNVRSSGPILSLTLTGLPPSITTSENKFTRLNSATMVLNKHAPTLSNTSNDAVGFPTPYDEGALYHYAQAGIRIYP